MTIWIIEPHDPLIVRDGRPFGPNPGARAKSLVFPFPSTTTGGIRTRAGLNQEGIFELQGTQLDLLKQLHVRGPLLVQLTNDGHDIAPDQWLVPAPLDALLLPAQSSDTSKENTALVQQLLPLALLQDATTDLDQEDLMLVGMSKPDQRKPVTNAPQYWYWKTFQNWLLNPLQHQGKPTKLFGLGLNGPQHEQRMHVSIDNDKAVSKDGMLFETAGLEFTASDKQEKSLQKAHRLALAIAVDDDHELAPRLSNGLASFGGERRIVSWRKSSATFPECPQQLTDTIVHDKFCRIFLLTPAYFTQGYRPKWLLENRDGVRPQLKAIATSRTQVVSGWDLALGKPKPTKRLASSGTVLFLSLEDNDGETTIRNWVKNIWMHCVSDEPQDQKDGFGLAVIGTWSGQPEVMKG